MSLAIMRGLTLWNGSSNGNGYALSTCEEKFYLKLTYIINYLDEKENNEMNNGTLMDDIFAGRHFLIISVYIHCETVAEYSDEYLLILAK
jgi:hypothetical protein